MTELSPKNREQVFEPGWLRRIADFVIGVDPEARRAEELKTRARNQQENEVVSGMVSQALAWNSRVRAADLPDAEIQAHDRSDLGLKSEI